MQRNARIRHARAVGEREIYVCNVEKSVTGMNITL